MTKRQLSAEEHQALVQFAYQHGSHWKSHLRDSWMSGCYPGVRSAEACILHALRNASYFGPAGLAKYNPKEATNG